MCCSIYYIRKCQYFSDHFVDLHNIYFRFCGKVKHYKLYFDGHHYVRDKRFDSLQDLVADGLITLHIEAEAGPYIALMSDMVRLV